MSEMEFSPSPETTEPNEPVTEVTVPPVAQKEVRTWKPKNEEFFLDQDFAQLIVDLGEDSRGPVRFDVVDEERDGVAGHALVATVLSNPS